MPVKISTGWIASSALNSNKIDSSKRCDLHLHVEIVAQAEADVNFVRNTIGAAKKIISTEFSLVGQWNQYSDVPLENPGLNGCPAGMKLFEW